MPSLAYLDLDVAVTDGHAGAPAAQADGAGQADPGRRDRSAGPRARCRLRHRLFVGAAGAAGAQVVALEEDATLARHARENLAAVGAANAEVVSGALPDGWQAGAPYDVILSTARPKWCRSGCCASLAEGGRLVGVVGRAPASKAVLYLAAGGQASALPIFDAAAPPLPGFAEPPAFVF